MTTAVGIGEFSRLTHLSVKALRHYHDIALLVPAEIDPGTGYRRYATGQVHAAQMINRLRSLQMPLPQIQAVLATDDTSERDRLLHDHLQRMEAELDRTRQVVASLRGLLGTTAPSLAVELRDSPAIDVLAVRETVARDDIYTFCNQAFSALTGQLAESGVTPGSFGATYDENFFTEDRGSVVAYLELPAGTPPLAVPNNLVRTGLPGGRFAVALHSGPYIDFDRTYGALGSYVVEHLTPLPEPIREIYLVGPDDADDATGYRTEVCWPIAA
jgi:DNA-binding transcriptional MerR regulator